MKHLERGEKGKKTRSKHEKTPGFKLASAQSFPEVTLHTNTYIQMQN